MDETPRSRYARSAWKPSSWSRRRPSANSMSRKRVAHATSAANSSKYRAAAGSRSMHTIVPVLPMRSAIRRAWPPAPKVQSITVSPGCGSTMSISSPARTGTCVRVMSRRIAKTLCDAGHLVGKVGLVRRITGAIPDLQMVDIADDDDLAVDGGVFQELRVERDASRRVEFDVERAAAEEAREAAALGAEWMHVTDEALVEVVEAVRGEDRDAGIEPAGKDKPVRERS